MKMYQNMNYLIPELVQGVYIIFDIDDQILYIGMAANLQSRLSAARLDRDFSNHNFGYYYVYYTFDYNQRFELEKHLIRLFQPKLNKYKFKTWLKYPHKKFD